MEIEASVGLPLPPPFPPPPLSGATVNPSVPETEPRVAVIVAGPALTADKSPAELTVATDVLELCQVTCDVSTCVLPSEYVPCADSCSVVPAVGFNEVPETAMDVNVAWPTVTAKVPETPSMVAVIVTLPALMAETSPLPATVAIVESEAFHVTWDVRDASVPSL